MSVSLKNLEAHLADKSYVSGYTASQADVTVFKALAEAAPSASEYPHSARWYAHIATYAAEHNTLPGEAHSNVEAYIKEAAAAAPAVQKAQVAAEEDDDIDLFGSDDEEADAEAEKLKQQRLAEYAAKKAKKPATIAKSVVTLEVKPWDDETDMKKLEESVRSVEQDGLVWGLSKLVPVGYGVNKLQITLVIEDEKVSLDDLQDKLAEFEDYVQSSDVAAMQKL